MQRSWPTCSQVQSEVTASADLLRTTTVVALVMLNDYPRPCVTVDVVVLTIVDTVLRVLLVRRDRAPFRDSWALPGGFLRVGASAEAQGESLDEAAQRELAEETGLPEGRVWLKQFGAFGEPGRDPRTRVVTVAYCALVRPTLVPLVRGGGDAAEAAWYAVDVLDELGLAFDHHQIVQSALSYIAAELERTPIAFELVPETFTVSELRAVYDVVTGSSHDPANFRRRFKRMIADGVVEAVRGKRITGARPAGVYRFCTEGSERRPTLA